MKNLTIKALKSALENLDENKEVEIRFYSNTGDDPVSVELVKEIKENGKEYYRLLL